MTHNAVHCTGHPLSEVPVPNTHDIAYKSHCSPRHRADSTPPRPGNQAPELLSLPRHRERPLPGERHTPPPWRVPGMMDLHPTDPRNIGHYQVLGRLGSGSQGVVYLAVTPPGDQVAIKRLRCGVGSEQARRQFAKEVVAARRIAPFCTAQLIDAQLDGPAPYLVSEYVPGPSLRQKISQDGPMSGTALDRLAVSTVTAVAAIHQADVVHCDVQPANVMLSPDGPRIIAYAATGRAPFEADHPMALAYRTAAGVATLTGVPATLTPLLRCCLDKDPAQRPTARQALTTLLSRPELRKGQRSRSPRLIRDGSVAAEQAASVAVRAA